MPATTPERCMACRHGVQQDEARQPADLKTTPLMRMNQGRENQMTVCRIQAAGRPTGSPLAPRQAARAGASCGQMPLRPWRLTSSARCSAQLTSAAQVSI